MLEKWKKDFESLYNPNSEGSDKVDMKYNGHIGIPVETSLKEENTDPELNIQLEPAILNDLNADITIE